MTQLRSFLYRREESAANQTTTDIMDNHGLHVLEYPRLLELIASFASTQCGHKRVRAMQPRSSQEEIELSRHLYAALMQLCRADIVLPRLTFNDVSAALNRARPVGAVLSVDDLLACRLLLDATHELQKFTAGEPCRSLPAVQALSQRLDGSSDLYRALRHTFDKDGEIRDDASSELYRIRQRRRALERTIRKLLEGMLRQLAGTDILQDQFITVRNDRHVVPVRRECKNRVRGVVHDHSDSGRTLFVEPEETLPLGNELADIMLEERDELLRIIGELSDQVRCNREVLQRDQEALTVFDAASAVALWGTQYECILPEFGNALCLRHVRHPLLAMQFRQANRENELVPLDLDLRPECRTLVITGSNSGGKTVAIKTVGLVVLAAQAGLPIPAGENTRMPVFSYVFADIGDEQSLEENLSTFTGHLRRTATILEKVTEEPRAKTLILLDELGTGTDPLEGGALGCALLEELCRYETLTVATTHLGSIKSFAHEADHMLNASVRFNLETLEPEYAIDVGQPGASHALMIAERLGMDPNVMEAARLHLTRDHLQLESMLAKLEEQQRRAEVEERQTHQALEEAVQDREAARSERDTLRAERKKLLHEAYKQAEQIVADTRRQMEQLVADIQSSKKVAGEREARRQAQRLVRKRSQTLEAAVSRTRPRAHQPVSLSELRTGDVVWVEKLHSKAHIKGVYADRGEAVVSLGHLDFTVAADQLGQVTSDQPETDLPRMHESRPKVEGAVSHELNLVGRRVHEALPLLERFLNTAVLAGFDEVRVIHGHGTGRLKAAVHQALTDSRLVQRFRVGDSGKDPGGAGATFVTLNTK
ncbi:MAG: endonuclease MutS2 [Candidatus Pacebacteria bacterium]|nr:endonuclease MutS2 [Candidatus Paceibacterota bacterium]